MVYKQITEEQYYTYFPWNGEHEEVGPKHVSPSSPRTFGKRVIWRTRSPDFVDVACYVLLPDSHTHKHFSTKDLHFYVSKEYLMNLLLSSSASADSGD